MKQKLMKMRPYLLVWALALLCFELWGLLSSALVSVQQGETQLAVGSFTQTIGVLFPMLIWPVAAFAVSAAYTARNGFYPVLALFIWLIIVLIMQVIPTIMTGKINDFFQPIFRDGCLLMGSYALIALIGMGIGRTAYPRSLGNKK